MPRIKGGSISANDTKHFISQSYLKNSQRDDAVGNYILDRELSSDRAAVYHNPLTQKTLICNRGTAPTLQDWSNNLALARGQYNDTARMKHALETQRSAIEKYGSVDTNVGHSQSQAIASNLNKRGMTGEIITVNGATMPWDTQASNETRIRSKGDVVSAVQSFLPRSRNLTIDAESFNPLTEHSASILDRVNSYTVFGKGFMRTHFY